MQIPISDRSRTYELTYLIPGSVTSDVVSKAMAEVGDLLKKHKFAVQTQEEWGKKPLAYPIKHHGKKEVEATYVHVVADAVTKGVPAFEADLRLNQQVMRSLLVLAEKSAPSNEATVEVVEESENE